jgi:hypothetical protein
MFQWTRILDRVVNTQTLLTESLAWKHWKRAGSITSTSSGRREVSEHQYMLQLNLDVSRAYMKPK